MDSAQNIFSHKKSPEGLLDTPEHVLDCVVTVDVVRLTNNIDCAIWEGN